MERAVFDGALELRQAGAGGPSVLRGSFPYAPAVGIISNRGRRRKERFSPLAFDFSIKRAEAALERLRRATASGNRAAIRTASEEASAANINILSGHDFGKPLGDLLSGTARLTNTREALQFEVDMPRLPPTYFEDIIRQIGAGLLLGVSIGFNIPPNKPNAEREVPEEGNPNVTVREVNDALLYEVSIVTRPSHGASMGSVEMRGEALELNPQRRRLAWL